MEGIEAFNGTLIEMALKAPSEFGVSAGSWYRSVPAMYSSASSHMSADSEPDGAVRRQPTGTGDGHEVVPTRLSRRSSKVHGPTRAMVMLGDAWPSLQRQKTFNS